MARWARSTKRSRTAGTSWIKTVGQVITINKYAEVNIAGFRDLVDAVGGVEPEHPHRGADPIR